jgi:hypothetical protein
MFEQFQSGYCTEIERNFCCTYNVLIRTTEQKRSVFVGKDAFTDRMSIDPNCELYCECLKYLDALQGWVFYIKTKNKFI